MVRFLIQRPIAVLMITVALAILGLLAFLTMPVSLLPNVEIPEIIVKISYPNIDARSLENTIIKPTRLQLMDVSGLKNIESETGDGYSQVKLTFNHSTNIDYAYIEVNEKIDALSDRYPRKMKRPQVIRIKPSDIPVFYVSIVPEESYFHSGRNFVQLSDFAEAVVKRRLEQISAVSMVDLSGLEGVRIIIRPYTVKLKSTGLSIADLTHAITKSNIEPGNLSVRDGYFVYNLQVKPAVQNLNDLKNLNIYKAGKLFKLKNLASVRMQPDNGGGLFYHNGVRAVSMAVYKQPDARMHDVKAEVAKALKGLSANTKNIHFEMEQDQTELLEFSLSNLKQTLILGVILAVLIMFLFIRQPGIPIVTAFSVPVALVISFFFLYLAGISLNIISLSGIILSVGLMIDNSIIVLDNINQYRIRGQNPPEATIRGTNEVIRPLISSVLTTCAVFIPLITLSGLAGAIFYDQAITVAISLTISLLVSIFIIPVLYFIFNKNRGVSTSNRLGRWLLFTYEKTMLRVLKHKVFFSLLFLLLIPIGILFYSFIKKEKFPELTQTDMVLNVEWNEPVSLDENKKRVFEITKFLKPILKSTSDFIGKEGFSMNVNENQSYTSAFLYLDFDSAVNVSQIGRKIKLMAYKEYPLANITVLPSKNIFRTVFSPRESALVARFQHKQNLNITPEFIRKINAKLKNNHLPVTENTFDFSTGYEIIPRYNRLILYGIPLSSVISKLKVLLGGALVDQLSTGNKMINILIRNQSEGIYKTLNSQFVVNSNGASIPLLSLLKIRKIQNVRNINSDKQGEYYSVVFNPGKQNKQKIESAVQKAINSLKNVQVSWSGSLYEQISLMKEFMFIMGISLILLYLILAAQFESLLLPFIILIEIFLDITGSIFFLYIFHSSLNLMSGLGIIIMSGIVINDSIIKVDAIRGLHNSGKPLIRAIIEGGKRRFYPIVMTSLTTILALVPLLFFKGLGVELQVPLALTIIGGLFVGTFVSLFFVPVLYLFFSGKKSVLSEHK